MKINKKQEETIVNFGVFDYTSEQIAIILEIHQNIIDLELKNKDSELNKLLLKGKNLADYVIDLKLFELAKAGDIQALDRLEKRKHERQYNIKE